MQNRKNSILVVDDEEIIARLVRHVAGAAGIGVESASTCAECRSLLQAGAFDLAFMDVHLPDGDGIDLIRDLMESHPGTAVIAISGGLTREEEIRIRKLRVSLCLIKPFSLAEIRSVITHAAERNGWSASME